MPDDELDEVRRDAPETGTDHYTADALKQGAENAPRHADDASGRETHSSNWGQDEQEPEDRSTGDD